MGRKSKLTAAQWDEIQKRHLSGEAMRALAREFGVAESSIRERISAQSQGIKSVAKQLVDAECALKQLPIASQISALNLADELRAVSAHLTSAARYSSMTSHRLAGIANGRVDKIDESRPLADDEALRAIAVLTRISNDASEIGLNLLRANKDGGNKDSPRKMLVENAPDAS